MEIDERASSVKRRRPKGYAFARIHPLVTIVEDREKRENRKRNFVCYRSVRLIKKFLMERRSKSEREKEEPESEHRSDPSVTMARTSSLARIYNLLISIEW